MKCFGLGFAKIPILKLFYYAQYALIVTLYITFNFVLYIKIKETLVKTYLGQTTRIPTLICLLLAQHDNIQTIRKTQERNNTKELDKSKQTTIIICERNKKRSVKTYPTL